VVGRYVLQRTTLCLAALLGSACYDFHLFGPEDPAPVPTPPLVAVTIEYRQPNGCINDTTPCGGPVVFFGSWMRGGAEFPLTPDAGNHVWRGVALGVPANYPPRDEPYAVRVFDPYLRESLTEGMTAERLRVGGELITNIDRQGGRNEAGLVYIDLEGRGHNAF
jgi:hypothetical protein